MIYEYIGNLHMHTPYSDGYGSHSEIALAALQAGLDFVVVTDHNLWVDGMDGYRYLGDDRVLLLTGEEIHDPTRIPQKNHLLVLESRRELAPFADKPQRLLQEVIQSGGLSFIAHPIDPAAWLFKEPDLSWEDWDLEGFTGIEIWNFMSEFKSHLRSIPEAVFYSYFPTMSSKGPFPEALRRWDRLLSSGRQIVAIGGSDAHAFPVQYGPLKRIVFPYEFLFRTVNTHVLTEEPLSGEMAKDRKILFQAIRQGHCFVGYDLAEATKGFRFSAQGDNQVAIMGDIIQPRYGITLQVKTPRKTSFRLIHSGEVIKRWDDTETATHTVTTPGAYRVEVDIFFRGKNRGWIYSNPIYIVKM